LEQPGSTCFAETRSRLDGFVAQNFTWPGTFRLHGAALGWDILRAPFNVALSPVFLLTRIAAYLFRRAGWRRFGDWLARRRILLPTTVAHRVEALIVTDLLGLPLAREADARDPSALAQAVLAAPQFQEAIQMQPSAEDAETLGRRISAALGDYAGTRSAVAEMTTAICALAIGALVFRALTPGVISMAPGVANILAHTAAVETFPLGETLGGLWYGVFAADAPGWLVGVTFAGMLMISSVFAAFAGVFADPVQSRLGIHRRRLVRLLDTVERAIVGREDKAFTSPEHYYARFLDVWDAAASALRMFRS
jgi:hypothetical protein